ncbi:MAG: hypothetical protein JWN29_1861 [Acidimicrobiales bacterium]|nr:hypothetical protein [Acidimicrobiales bacterium]
MQKKTGWIAAGAFALATIGGGVGIAAASGGSAGNDDGTPITGSAYDRATSVALSTAGGGRVTQTEQGDEEGYYQVEVTKADGTVTDVNLDQSFKVVKTKTEAAETNDDAPQG